MKPATRPARRNSNAAKPATTTLALAALAAVALHTESTHAQIRPVGAGSSHTLYIPTPVNTPTEYWQNTVWGMGQQTHNELGDFPFDTWTDPHIVGCRYGQNFIPMSLHPATAITGGRNHGIALMYDRSLRTWGDDSYGQLGNGSLGSSTCASRDLGYVAFPRGQMSPQAWAIAAGDFHNHAIVGTTAGYGQIATWGRSNAGQVGNGKAIGVNYTTPDCVRTGMYPANACLVSIRSIAAGESHGLAATMDGRVYSWGRNSDGQRGEYNVAAPDRSWALQVEGIDNVIAVAARGNMSMALKADGTVWCWGRFQSESENGVWTSCAAVPTQVPSLTGVTQLAVGRNHALAITTDGKVWGWGYNSFGGVGNPAVGYTSVPVLVSLPSFALAIAAGDYHSIVRTADGATRTWGRNNAGQLGNGNTVNQYLPVQITP